MTDRDDLILSTLMEIKSGMGEIKAITANQEQCIRELREDVISLKKSRDEVSGGWKVVMAVSAVIAAVMGWLSGYFGGMK